MNIDLDLIEKGPTYSDLNKTIIIFICKEDIFKKNRCIYTFENICLEDPALKLGDETTKIHLYTDGDAEGIDAELKAFLDYVGWREPKTDYAKTLDSAVKKARENVEWRREFMTLLTRDQENINLGKDLGKAEGIAVSILDPLYDLGEVPEDTQVTVMSEDDLELLRQWHKIAAKANSIEEFIERSGITDNGLT